MSRIYKYNYLGREEKKEYHRLRKAYCALQNTPVTPGKTDERVENSWKRTVRANNWKKRELPRGTSKKAFKYLKDSIK